MTMLRTIGAALAFASCAACAQPEDKPVLPFTVVWEAPKQPCGEGYSETGEIVGVAELPDETIVVAHKCETNSAYELITLWFIKNDGTQTPVVLGETRHWDLPADPSTDRIVYNANIGLILFTDQYIWRYPLDGSDKWRIPGNYLTLYSRDKRREHFQANADVRPNGDILSVGRVTPDDTNDTDEFVAIVTLYDRDGRVVWQYWAPRSLGLSNAQNVVGMADGTAVVEIWSDTLGGYLAHFDVAGKILRTTALGEPRNYRVYTAATSNSVLVISDSPGTARTIVVEKWNVVDGVRVSKIELPGRAKYGAFHREPIARLDRKAIVYLLRWPNRPGFDHSWLVLFDPETGQEIGRDGPISGWAASVHPEGKWALSVDWKGSSAGTPRVLRTPLPPISAR